MKTKYRITHPCATAFFMIIFLAGPLSAQRYDQEEDGFFFGSISPVVLPEDATEVNFVNSLNSFWIAFHEFIPQTNSSRIADRKRFTRFDQLLRISHGFSSSGRWDLGVDFRMVHVRLDEESRSSPFRVFEESSPTGRSDRALASIGLRTRIMPFESVPELTLQGIFSYPLARTPELRQRLGVDRSQFTLQATYFQNFNPSTFYFLQGEWNVLFAGEDHDQTTHVSALNGYLVFSLLDRQFFFYPGLTYISTYQKYSAGGSFGMISQQLYGGLGGQWQPAPSLGISLFLQRPFIFENGSEFSEWVRESFSSVTLGLRVVI